MIRKYLGAALVIASLFAACGKDTKGTENLTITGKVDGLKQGKVFLYHVQDTTFVVLDSLVVDGKSSNFTFKHHLESPEMLFLSLDRGHSSSIDNQLSFFAEPGTMTIETTLKNFFKDAKVSGSQSNELYNEYLKSRALITDRQNELYVSLFEAQKTNNTASLDSLQEVNKKLTGRLFLNAINFALNNKNSDVAPYIALTELYDRNIKYLDTIYNSLSPEIVNHKYGKSLNEFIQERKKEEAKANE
ncbi:MULTISPECIES: DUF4369 domain-containing protein [unclassified Myroides]|uniref:DUF4369 domain-containing protein n=1 Tax=unclassified Myroides TaxID=2642485 RepID=UPI0015FCC9E5|nr:MULTISPECIES: DUF4369 domain-containing protein [unclassified Myroides]MBB1150311.1 DUF4369 domain-containing protein [Myroides sp. NP-2]MDM1408019.1 DUF4369 domain-containing protein [Myroides sp. DF42-4-2]